jgi:hypothetical protein
VYQFPLFGQILFGDVDISAGQALGNWLTQDVLVVAMKARYKHQRDTFTLVTDVLDEHIKLGVEGKFAPTNVLKLASISFHSSHAMISDDLNGLPGEEDLLL